LGGQKVKKQKQIKKAKKGKTKCRIRKKEKLINAQKGIAKMICWKLIYKEGRMQAQNKGQEALF